MADEQFEDGALTEAELDALMNSVGGPGAESSGGETENPISSMGVMDEAEPDPLADALGGGRSNSALSGVSGQSKQKAALRMSTFEESEPSAGGLSGFDRVQDIPLELTVELGRTRLLIKDILELGSGSIVELEKIAGEPVDLLANGLLIARGEVVVIEDSFGVRITQIITSAERKTVASGGGSGDQQPQSIAAAGAA